jgi:FkbM family methyltransferase
MIDLGLMTFVNGGSDENSEKRIQYGVEHTGRNPNTFQISGDTLSNVLLSIGNPQIDFLSLDVEGYEVDVLSGLDFSKHKPKLILVETKSPREISEKLKELYELIAQISHHDYLYRLID